MDMPIIHVEPVEDTAVDPDAANITPMPKEIDPNQLSADINGDALVNLADFAIMAQQWGKELEIPCAEK